MSERATKVFDGSKLSENTKNQQASSCKEGSS